MSKSSSFNCIFNAQIHDPKRFRLLFIEGWATVTALSWSLFAAHIVL